MIRHTECPSMPSIDFKGHYLLLIDQTSLVHHKFWSALFYV